MILRQCSILAVNCWSVAYFGVFNFGPSYLGAKIGQNKTMTNISRFTVCYNQSNDFDCHGQVFRVIIWQPLIERASAIALPQNKLESSPVCVLGIVTNTLLTLEIGTSQRMPIKLLTYSELALEMWPYMNAQILHQCFQTVLRFKEYWWQMVSLVSWLNMSRLSSTIEPGSHDITDNCWKWR